MPPLTLHSPINTNARGNRGKDKNTTNKTVHQGRKNRSWKGTKMNKVARISVALFSTFADIAPAVAADGAVVEALIQPQYWVMGISTLALIGLAVGGKPATTSDEQRDADFGASAFA